MMRHRFSWACAFLVSGAALLGCPSEDDSAESNSDSESSGVEVEGLSLVEGGHTVVIDESWKSCMAVEDCVVVGTSCDSCCAQDVVASSREAEYATSRTALCEPYMGGECDCSIQPATPVCEAGVCVLVPDE